MLPRLLILLCMFQVYTQGAWANETLLSPVPNAAVVGRGVLYYAFWDIYEATLYAPKGRFDPMKPFALSIKYYHAIDGKHIADKSVQEIRKQGFNDEIKLATWHTQMKAIFPNVKDGTVLSAVYQPGKQTIFYNGNKFIGSIRGDDFARLFFAIWLGERTSDQKLRRALLGLS
jgi:hypothetical protein